MSKLKYNLRRYIMFLCLCKCCVHKIFINFVYWQYHLKNIYISLTKINECYRKSIRYKKM